MKKPKWYIEAKEAEIDYILLVYGKAEGFVFCPRNLEKPFRVGGGYDGNWPVSADGAIEYFEKYIHRAYRDEVRWIIPYAWKIFVGEDFSLDDLKIEQRGLSTISGRWPW